MPDRRKVRWTMMRYVVGLLFCPEMRRVALIYKLRGPDAVVGKWNGIGGKIEEWEEPHEAMVREFEEEARAKVSVWVEFCTLGEKSLGYEVTFFWSRAVGSQWEEIMSMTDEPVASFSIDDLPKALPSNIRWMIPFILDPDVGSLGRIGMCRSID